MELEKEDQEEHPPVSKQILALMVRDILFKLKFPYANFCSCGVTGEELFPIMWERIQRLEASEIKVCVSLQTVLALTGSSSACTIAKKIHQHFFIRLVIPTQLINGGYTSKLIHRT